MYQSKYTVDVMTIFVKHGFKVNETEELGKATPLHWAADRNTEWTASIVEFLLDHGADVNLKDEEGCIALHHATRLSHTV